MKKRITRITTMFMAVFIMAIIAALPVTAFAADEVAAVAISEETAYDSDITVIQPMVNDYEEPVIQQLGNNQGESKSSKSGSAAADSAYESTMDFILTWVRRVGAAVALFGVIMLALALKKKDPDSKEDAIWAMVAGFVVWAVVGAADMFDLYS